ncbi:MAG: Holliday junction resolvase RuvX [Ruminococcaceae bacterium]|nr:Holliday junction resolvase RuvX [Oscillospiraceae bacterium]
MNPELELIAKTKGKILGVDLGDTRTGIAVSDPSRLISSGLETISPGGIEKTADAVADIAKANGVCAIVVGLPVNMDGSEGARAAKCRKFADLLRMRLGESVLVAMFDERMTTMTASRYLNETNTRGKKRKGVIDTLSAQIILQNAIDRLRYMAN